jgi:hypothetical protein
MSIYDNVWSLIKSISVKEKRERKSDQWFVGISQHSNVSKAWHDN